MPKIHDFFTLVGRSDPYWWGWRRRTRPSDPGSPPADCSSYLLKRKELFGIPYVATHQVRCFAAEGSKASCAEGAKRPATQGQIR